MARFYAPKSNFDGANVALDTDETRHLRDVLRLRAGSEVFVFDGEGREFRCRVRKVNKASAELDLIGETAPASPESRLQLTLAPALLKNDRFDIVVQKAVELGVHTLIPIQTLRCEVKPRDIERRLDRLRRIALEATKQSGRARLMTIGPLTELSEVLAERGEILMFSERDGGQFPAQTEAKKMTAVVGPVGGWDDAELEMAKLNGVSIVTFGGRILRAETASISIATILQHRFGDLN